MIDPVLSDDTPIADDHMNESAESALEESFSNMVT